MPGHGGSAPRDVCSTPPCPGGGRGAVSRRPPARPAVAYLFRPHPPCPLPRRGRHLPRQLILAPPRGGENHLRRRSFSPPGPPSLLGCPFPEGSRNLFVAEGAPSPVPRKVTRTRAAPGVSFGVPQTARQAVRLPAQSQGCRGRSPRQSMECYTISRVDNPLRI